ncbi:23825_t:CDS:2 [Dentiscutata erythropus]|uniref:23825_t:CDS:1 n=1 Tax=Dentiscutata erythropus TaxID=1348616 RepID=A0A9N9NCB7_9GLOM|nr:23825_t:CDS:2 [Dentiscutata erythropus]
MKDTGRYSDNGEFQGYMDQYLWEIYHEKLFETAKKQVEIERYMLINGMLYSQEKEIVKYNIQEITNREILWGQILDSLDLDYCYIDDNDIPELLV